MITIKMTTSSPKAIELAKRLLASKKETQAEMRAFAKTPEFRQRLEELKRRNAEDKEKKDSYNFIKIEYDSFFVTNNEN
jgi:hypothetical protein